MKLARVMLVVLGLSGCDRRDGDEADELRAELRELRGTVAALEGRVATLEQQLTLEREARARSEILARARESAPEPATTVVPADGATSTLGPIQCSAGRCAVPRATVDAILADPMLVAKSARVVPHLKEGEPAGFKVFGIRAGSLPAQIGLKNGDIVTALGGRSILDINAAMDAVSALPAMKTWVIEGERAGAPLSITVAVEG